MNSGLLSMQIARALARASGITIVVSVSACAPTFEAPTSAVLAGGPNAPGYLIVGLAERNYRHEFGVSTQFILLRFKGDRGQTAVITRSGCGSPSGLYGPKPCNLEMVDRQVLQVEAGMLKPDLVLEKLHVFVTDKTLSEELPKARAIMVGPGEVVYAGDYTFASDFDGQEIKLVQRDRNDAGAMRALSAYPGLRQAHIIYRGEGTGQ